MYSIKRRTIEGLGDWPDTEWRIVAIFADQDQAIKWLEAQQYEFYDYEWCLDRYEQEENIVLHYHDMIGYYNEAEA